MRCCVCGYQSTTDFEARQHRAETGHYDFTSDAAAGHFDTELSQRSQVPQSTGDPREHRHCSHCRGSRGPCACCFGCVRPSSSSCFGGHCLHCRGLRGMCACHSGCARHPQSQCCSGSRGNRNLVNPALSQEAMIQTTDELFGALTMATNEESTSPAAPPPPTLIRTISRNNMPALTRAISSEDCIICMDAIETGRALTLTCSHVFHEDCINVWLINHSDCPVCRATVVS